MKQPDVINLRRLSFGALCIEGDGNMPARAEALGDIDIDWQIPGVAKKAGLNPGDVAVDVGGFIGDTALALSRAGCKVIAFEPFLDAFVCMLYNTRGLDVMCINKPVGNGERVELVYECPGDNKGMRSVRETTNPSCLTTFRLDELCLDRCDFIKIDCEGSEIPTLLGASKTIAKFRPKMLIEMYADGLALRGFTPEQLKETIEGMGYELEMLGEPPRWDWFCNPKAK